MAKIPRGRGGPVNIRQSAILAIRLTGTGSEKSAHSAELGDQLRTRPYGRGYAELCRKYRLR